MALNAAECLTQGKCIVMTKTVYSVFVGLGVLCGIFLLILFLVGFFTPALIFLKAKFKKGVLIYTVNRGQSGEFKVATIKHQGIADVQKVGPYIISENSHTIEKKSKTPFYFAFGEFATTLPLEYAMTVQNLREAGEKINSISDLARLIGLKFDTIGKVWKKKVYEEKPDSDITPEQRENREIGNAELKPFKTIKIHDLVHMFPFNITPALVESKTQHMIGLKMHMFNKMNMQYVIMFIMILMGTTLAAVIAFKFLQTGDTTGAIETTTIIERVISTSGIQNLTG